MKRRYLWIIFSTISMVIACAGLSAQERYLRIQTRRIGTAKKDLAEAAGRGYRVRAGVGCCGFVLEKVVQPPTVYDYLIIERANDLVRFNWKKAKAEVENQLKEAGAKGYRVVPQAIASMDVGNYEQFILMEKPPGDVQAYEYRLGGSSQTLEGFRPVRMIWQAGWAGGAMSGSDVLGHPHSPIAVLERVANTTDIGVPEITVLQKEDLLPLENELRKLASEGYRVACAAETELRLVLERTASVPKFEYSIVGAEKAAIMEQQLNQAGNAGYRLIPRAFGKYDKPIQTKGPTYMGVKVEAFAVLEHDLASSNRYEYVLASTSEQLLESAQSRYEPVAMQDFKDKVGVIVLERRR